MDKENPHCMICDKTMILYHFTCENGVYNSYYKHQTDKHKASVVGEGPSLIEARNDAKHKGQDIMFKE